MKNSIPGAAFVTIIGALTIATGALAQLASDSGAVKASASIAHIGVAPRAVGFGVAKVIETRSIKIRNAGNIDASVTVVAPSTPFSVTAGGGSYSLTPGQIQYISIQFAPTAAGPVRQEMAIQCANCTPASDDNIAITLSGNAKAPIAVPTGTSPSATPTSPTATPTATPVPSTSNALPFSVTAGSYEGVDEPYASVTICATGTSDCTVVNDVLIDTGSFGLRIFGSQIRQLGITPNTNGSSEIGECAFFGSGTTWGSVSTVDVKIAGAPTITIPIQVMDDIDAFASPPRDCTQGQQLIASPSEAGFNGLLGIGQVANALIFTDYFDCTRKSCSGLDSPPNSDVVLNPVASFPVDNNGVVVSLPSIPAGGQATTNGTLYFGIGTESNNQPGAVKTYRENSNADSDDYLDVDTVYKGATAGGFFDTGSNGYFFNSSVAECSDGSGFYCPASTLSESATIESVSGSVSDAVSFEVANADTLFNSNGAAFDDLGGSYDGGATFDDFDWGLPFFFGRTVYLGLVGSSSSLGAGPYAAY